MSHIALRISIGRSLAVAALVSSTAGFAQAPLTAPAPKTGPASEASPMFQRHHAMAGIMRDMAREMGRMQDDMAMADLKPEKREQMASKLKRMSEMMRLMSGAVDRPTMKEPEMRRRFDEMRRQLDEMSRSHSGAEPVAAAQ